MSTTAGRLEVILALKDLFSKEFKKAMADAEAAAKGASASISSAGAAAAGAGASMGKAASSAGAAASGLRSAGSAGSAAAGGLGAAGAAAERTSSSLSKMRQIGTSMMTAGARLGVMWTAPLVLAGKQALDAIKMYDAAEKGLRVFMGSTQQAQEEMRRLRKLADEPGGSFQGNMRMALQFQAAGYSAEQSRRIIRELNNEMAKFGASSEEMSRMAINIRQVTAAGTLAGDELREMSMLVPTVTKYLQEAFGASRTDDLRKLGVTGKDAIAAIVAGMERGSRAANDSLAVGLRRVENIMFDLKIAAAEAFAPLAEAVGPTLVGLLKDAAAGLKGMSVEQKNALAGGAVFLALLGPTVVALGAVVRGVAELGIAFTALKGGMLAIKAMGFGGVMSAILNPVVLATAAIIGLAGAIAYFGYKAATWESQSEADFQSAIKRRVQSAEAVVAESQKAQELADRYDELSKVTNRTAEQNTELRRVLEDLVMLNPQLVRGFNLQSESIAGARIQYDLLAQSASKAVEEMRIARMAEAGARLQPLGEKRSALGEQISLLKRQMNAYADLRRMDSIKNRMYSIEGRTMNPALNEEWQYLRKKVGDLYGTLDRNQTFASLQRELSKLQTQQLMLTREYDDIRAGIKEAGTRTAGAAGLDVDPSGTPKQTDTSDSQRERTARVKVNNIYRDLDKPLIRALTDSSVRATCSEMTAKFYKKFGIQMESVAVSQYRQVKAKQQLFFDESQVKVGDMVFMDNKKRDSFNGPDWKRIGANSYVNHVGIIEEIRPDGTIMVYHNSPGRAAKSDSLDSLKRSMKIQGFGNVLPSGNVSVPGMSTSTTKVMVNASDRMGIDPRIQELYQYITSNVSQMAMDEAKTAVEKLRVQHGSLEGTPIFAEAMKVAQELDARESARQYTESMTKFWGAVVEAVADSAKMAEEARERQRQANDQIRKQIEDAYVATETRGMGRADILSFELSNTQRYAGYNSLAIAQLLALASKMDAQDAADEAKREQERRDADRLREEERQRDEAARLRQSSMEAFLDMQNDLLGRIAEVRSDQGFLAGQESSALRQRFQFAGSPEEVERMVSQIVRYRQELKKLESEQEIFARLADRMASAFTDAFSEIASGQRSMAGAIVNAFRSMFAEIAAEWVRTQMQRIIYDLGSILGIGSRGPTPQQLQAASIGQGLANTVIPGIFSSSQSLATSNAVSSANASLVAKSRAYEPMLAAASPGGSSAVVGGPGGTVINITINVSGGGDQAERSAGTIARAAAASVQEALARRGV